MKKIISLNALSTAFFLLLGIPMGFSSLAQTSNMAFTSVKTNKNMNDQSYSTTILVEQSPVEAYNAINNPRAWWSEDIEGNTVKVNDEFTYHFGDSHRSKLKVTESAPGKKVVWLVEENYWKSFKDQKEWVGNKITFDISKEGDKTKLVFTQFGLVPTYECYKACDWAWTGFVQKSLKSLIETGKGQLKWYEQK
jgi:hypothetical protein